MRAASRGFTIHYTVEGDGPPLMLVAPTMSSARHWDDLGYVSALSGEWRVINVDPLGHGDSDLPHDPDAYDPAGVATDLIAVMDAEGVNRATVWGYSRGGWLACNLASRYSERVERIVVGGYAMHAHEEEADRLLTPLASFLRQGDWAALWRAFGSTDTALQQMIEDSNDGLALAAAIEGSMRPTRFIDPASIHCPAVYYVGSEDWILPHVRADAEALDATVDVIAGQSHLGAFFDAVKPVLAAVTPRLGRTLGSV
ncbi:MAG TPA: alpha/beta hydrolase [Mycobacterium sp.]|nr:alpha/beta hydrolase [Mycobacterium sp.]